MITLRTIRRVLALELGLDSEGVHQCLSRTASISATDADATQFPLAEGLRIVAIAEGLAAPASA